MQFISNEEGAASTQPTLTPAEKIDKEVQAYLDLSVASSDTDRLVWWRMEHDSLKLQESIITFAVQVCYQRECLAQLGTFVMTAEVNCYPRM